ncbi:T9SS type A sorting domain-containing protein [Hymenobacter artigasi]|uniref:Secretion system C-terminal sorting domain-containing protein n=1 Tax=Hymenobacter artigasi TaxID=2719616 RepID=A0ABX1HCK1_9BACT|nr:T9SS type A sorting domain-containing protein [Hymenobacter artigasi]NKI87690.1 hypothetical protein [Hymenobacter artigasi]
MKHLSSLLRGGLPAALLILMWLAGPAARAQVPAWQSLITPSQAAGYNGSGTSATATDASGNVFVVGSFTGTVSFGTTTLTSAGGSDAFVAKWSPTTSTFVWAQRIGGPNLDGAGAVAVAGTSVYVAGDFSSTASFGGQALTSAGGTDAYVAKLTDLGATGTFVWAQRAGGFSDDRATDLARTGADLYVVGSFSGTDASFGTRTLLNSGGADAFVAKLTDLGTASTFVWAQRAGGTGVDGAWAVAASGTNVYLAGYFNSASASFGSTQLSIGSPGGNNYDGFVAKLMDQGATGSFVWAQAAGGTGRDEARAVAVNGANVYVAGYFAGAASFGSTTLTSAGGYDTFVAKLTDAGPTGGYAWAQRAGGTGDDQAQALVVAGTAVYIAGGFYSPTATFGPNTLTNAGVVASDVFVARLTDAGPTSTFAWAQQAGGTSGDNATALWVSGQQLLVGGSARPLASFGSFAIPGPSGSPESTSFLASLTDPTLTATTAAQSSLSFALAPNPARTAATLTLPALPGTATATLTLRDALGRAVRTETVALPLAGLRHELDLSGLPAGIYAVQVQAGKATATRRLVVE